jgi:hypothetical protein
VNGFVLMFSTKKLIIRKKSFNKPIEQPVSYKIRPFYEINEGKCMNKYTLEKTEGPITDRQPETLAKLELGTYCWIKAFEAASLNRKNGK